jgi:hypothetical protein
MTTTLRRVRNLAWLPRTSLAVPAAAALGSAAFFAWKPGVALSTFASPRAFGFAASVGILTLALGWLLPRLGRGFVLTAAAQTVPVAVAFVVTVLPAFRTITVNDPLPSVPAAAASSGTGEGAASPSASSPAVQPPVSTTTTLGRAALTGIDHRASGDAVLIRLSDGSHVIRLEHLDVEPGPDYFVFVVPGPEHRAPDGGTRLNHLRGNRGNQNYPVPTGVSVTRPLTVLIWCRAFAVPIAAATLH